MYCRIREILETAKKKLKDWIDIWQKLKDKLNLNKKTQMQKDYPKEIKNDGKKSQFICGLHNIVVYSDLGDGITLFPGNENPELPVIKLTNNKKKIAPFITKDMQTLIGGIETDHLFNYYPMVAYAEGEFNSDRMTSIQYLDSHLFLLKGFFFCLWLVKDNAADFDIGFLHFKNDKNDSEVSSNVMTNVNFDCKGKRDANVFTSEELNLATKFLSEYIRIEYQNRPVLMNASPVHRRTIANYFIQNARIVSDLGLKIANYCSMLEALFANGDLTELSHRLSERVAKFLKTDVKDRIEMYKTLKKMYDLRSKVVHGANYKIPGGDGLATLVGTADEICRTVMNYSLSTQENNIFELSVDDLNTYFLDLVLR